MSTTIKNGNSLETAKELTKLTTKMEGYDKTMDRFEATVGKIRDELSIIKTEIFQKIDGLKSEYATKKEVESQISILKSEFTPSKSVVEGLVGTILRSVLVAILVLIGMKTL